MNRQVGGLLQRRFGVPGTPGSDVYSHQCRESVNPTPTKCKSLNRAVTALDLRFPDTATFNLWSRLITEQVTIFDKNELIKLMPLSPVIKVSFC